MRLLRDEHWSVEQEYMRGLVLSFPSHTHKTGFHDLIESSYLYGMYDNAMSKWIEFHAEDPLPRKQTVLAAMRAASASMTPHRVEEAIRYLSENVAKEPKYWSTLLRATAPVSLSVSFSTTTRLSM